MPRTVLLIGVGFIGGSILEALRAQGEQYSISALVRKSEQENLLRGLGVNTIQGSLDDFEIIKDASSRHDIIIHSASANHPASAEAVLAGLRARSDKTHRPIYIHTSGAACFWDGNLIDPSSSPFIANDSSPEELDAIDLADESHVAYAGRKTVDLLRKAARNEDGSLLANVAIIFPTLVYGRGVGPFNKMSSQIPILIRASLKHGYAGYVGTGKGAWGHVHVSDLTDGYLRLIDHYTSLPKDSKNESVYCYAETGSSTWSQISLLIARELFNRQKVSSSEPRPFPTEVIAEYFWGPDLAKLLWESNVRCKGEKLRSIGWEPREVGGLEKWVGEDVEGVLEGVR